MLTIEKIEQNILTKYSDSDENIFIIRGSYDDSVIENAEKELGVTFAEDYKSFFKKYQCFSFGSSYISVPCVSEDNKDMARNLNIIYGTKEVKRLDPYFPKGMYLLEDPNYDSEIFIQDGAGNVYEYFDCSGLPPRKIHSSLREFLNAEYRYFDKRMKRIMAEQNK